MTGRVTFNKKRIAALLLIASVGIVAFLFVHAYVKYRPKMQLVYRTIAMATLAINLYADDHGHMPGGWDDLEVSGCIERRSPPPGASAPDYERSGIYQLPRKFGTIVLYHLSDIVVNWEFDPLSVLLVDGRLVRRDNGQEAFVIGRRPIDGGSGVIFDRDCGTRIYETLTRASASQPRKASD